MPVKVFETFPTLSLPSLEYLCCLTAYASIYPCLYMNLKPIIQQHFNICHVTDS